VPEHVLIPVAAALAVAGALTWLARRLALGRWRTVTAALAGGALAGLIAVELTSPCVGRWFADHPGTGAALTGVLLLALTVLVVEAAVEHSLRAAEERRWKQAGHIACRAIIDAAGRAIKAFNEDVLWPMTVWLARTEPGTDVLQDARIPERAARVSEEIRTAVLAAAPVLTATEHLHSLYTIATPILTDAADLAADVETWARHVSAGQVFRPGEPVSVRHAQVGWWADVLPAADRLDRSLRQFVKQIELEFDDRRLRPRITVPEDYERARRNFHPPGWE
jgi:hypothetical protein